MKFLRKLLKGLSITTALFVFQACYGTPRWLSETDMTFKVVSAVDGTPLQGVEISTRVYRSEMLDWLLCGYTDEDGTAEVMAGLMDGRSPEFRFKAEGETYAVKDTVISDLSRRIIEIKLSKAQ